MSQRYINLFIDQTHNSEVDSFSSNVYIPDGHDEQDHIQQQGRNHPSTGQPAQ